MVIRVAVRDVETAKRLVQELVSLFGGERVSFQADGEIQVELRGESNQGLANALNAVERWLEQTRIGTARVWVDSRAYMVERPRRKRQARRQPQRQIAGSFGQGGQPALEGSAE